jgi:putative membrane protein
MMQDESLKGSDRSPILRDQLAGHRTTLANERTFLAYARTSLTLFVAGITFIRFFGTSTIVVTGWILLPIGAITIWKGFQSFRKMKRLIREEEKVR